MNRYAYGTLDDINTWNIWIKYILDCFKETKMNTKHNILIAYIAELCLNKQTSYILLPSLEFCIWNVDFWIYDDNYHLAIL